MTVEALFGLPSAEEIMADELMRPRPTLTAVGGPAFARAEKPLFPPVPRLGPTTEGIHPPLYTTHFSPARRLAKTAVMKEVEGYGGLKATTIVYDEMTDIMSEVLTSAVTNAVNKAIVKTAETMGRRLSESFERAITGTVSTASAIKASEEHTLSMDKLHRAMELNRQSLGRIARVKDSNLPPVAEPADPSLSKSNANWGLF